MKRFAFQTIRPVVSRNTRFFHSLLAGRHSAAVSLLSFQRQIVLILQQHAALRADGDAAAGRDLLAVYLDIAGVRRDVDCAARAYHL